MCIIAVKPASKPMPSDSVLSTMWKRNSDGAGFMYAHNGKVYIRKGFMHFAKYQRALEQIPQNVPAVLHFRIATHGGISPGMCHPFPLTDNIKRLKATNQTARVGIAHNGIIPILPRKGLSDTAEYIASQLVPLSKALPQWYRNPHALDMVEKGIQSRMVVLAGTGELVTIGKGWIDDGGIKYSNTSYMQMQWDDWGLEGYGVKLLMPLYSDDCYLMVGGEAVEADDTAIDASGHVYVFDYDYYAWREASVSCTAYRHNGTPVRFDEALAEPLDVLEYDDWF